MKCLRCNELLNDGVISCSKCGFMFDTTRVGNELSKSEYQQLGVIDTFNILVQAGVVLTRGKDEEITKEMVKEKAIVIDVGINRIDNKLYGDVNYEDVLDKVSYITPVPGGVGPMTVVELGQNLLEAYKIRNDIR